MASIESNSSVEVPQLEHHKIKTKKPHQRSCNEKDAKGKLCGGHLKRWFYRGDAVEQEHGNDVEKAFGANAEIYRCEHCRTLYLPTEADARGPNVAGRGMISVFGLTVQPKK